MRKIIGFNGVLEAIKRGGVKEVTVSPSRKDSVRVREIIKSGIKILWKEIPHSVEATVQSKSRKIDEILEDLERRDRATVVILDHIQDSGNFGSIIRTADAFGVDLIIYPKRNAVQLTDIVIKISSGSYLNIDIVDVANINNIIEKLQMIGFWVYGAEAKGSMGYKNEYRKKRCLVMGSEEKGMNALTRSKCDFLVSIPIRIESLNVSQACSIILSEMYSQKEDR